MELAVTFHVLVQTQRHAHVADLDGLEVALDDHVARLHVAVQQLLLVVQILLKGGGGKKAIHLLNDPHVPHVVITYWLKLREEEATLVVN